MGGEGGAWCPVRLDPKPSIHLQTDRQIDRWIDKQIERKIDRWIDRQTDRQIEGKLRSAQNANCVPYKANCVPTEGKLCSHRRQIVFSTSGGDLMGGEAGARRPSRSDPKSSICIQTGIWIERQTKRQIDRQIDRKIERQIDRYTQIDLDRYIDRQIV